MLQRVGRIFVELDDCLQTGWRRMALGQLGCAAGADRAAVGR